MSTKPRTPAQITLDEPSRLLLPGHPTLHFVPTIAHRVTEGRAIGFGELVHLFDGGIGHTFEATIGPGDLYRPRRHRTRRRIVPWRALAPLVLNPADAPRFRRRATVDSEPELLIATLEVDELVASLVGAAGGWFNYLDHLPLTHSASLVHLVEQATGDGIVTKDLDFALLDGSLFYLRELHVHPAVRGQAIGARMIAHAVRVLTRSGSDLFVGIACPMSTRFAPERARNAVAHGGMHRLERYYHRLGFRTWRAPDATREEPPVIYFPAELQLNVRHTRPR